MMTKVPKVDSSVEEIARIMACMEVLEKYDADKACECREYVCPQHNLNRLHHDLRTFALFLAER